MQTSWMHSFPLADVPQLNRASTVLTHDCYCYIFSPWQSFPSARAWPTRTHCLFTFLSPCLSQAHKQSSQIATNRCRSQGSTWPPTKHLQNHDVMQSSLLLNIHSFHSSITIWHISFHDITALFVSSHNPPHYNFLLIFRFLRYQWISMGFRKWFPSSDVSLFGICLGLRSCDMIITPSVNGNLIDRLRILLMHAMHLEFLTLTVAIT